MMAEQHERKPTAMYIKIEIDTREELNDQDRTLLQALVSMGASGAATVQKTAKKTAPKPKPAEPEPEVVDAEIVPDEEDDESQGLKDAAVAKASDLLSSGQREKVMKALKEAGVGRVSEVPSDKIAAFLVALNED